MKLWLSKTSAVPVHEQLRTQLILGISSGDLGPGDKLPSTPEVARRFRVHANTVRAVYRDLVGGGWTEWRRGSGYYVRKQPPEKDNSHSDLDSLAAAFVETALRRGHSLTEIRDSVLGWISTRPPDRILIIEPDAELRSILVTEIRNGVDVRTEGYGMEACSDAARLTGALCVALKDHVEDVRGRIPAEVPLLELKSRSVARSMMGHPRPPVDTPITVISRWPDFLRWAHVTLTGVGLDPTAFDLRDARKKGWDRGLSSRSFIVADSIAAANLPASCKPIVFKLVSDESIAELRARLLK